MDIPEKEIKIGRKWFRKCQRQGCNNYLLISSRTSYKRYCGKICNKLARFTKIEEKASKTKGLAIKEVISDEQQYY